MDHWETEKVESPGEDPPVYVQEKDLRRKGLEHRDAGQEVTGSCLVPAFLSPSFFLIPVGF